MRKSTKLILILATLIFGVTSFFIVTKMAKWTAIEASIFASRVGFTVPVQASGEQNISLLYSTLATQNLAIENFSAVQLMTHSAAGTNRAFNNTIRIVPDSETGRIVLRSPASDILILNAFCGPGSRVVLHRLHNRLDMKISDSAHEPILKLSLPAPIEISLQACKVLDSDGRDLTHVFQQAVSVELHDLSKSLAIAGRNGALTARVDRAGYTMEHKAEFVLGMRVESLDFSRPSFTEQKVLKISTIDSLYITREEPLGNKALKAQNPGDLALLAEPNAFKIFQLFEMTGMLYLNAQGRFKSFTAGKGAIVWQGVPKMVNYLAENQTLSLLVAWLGWLLTVPLPFVLKNFFNRQKAKQHAQEE